MTYSTFAQTSLSVDEFNMLVAVETAILEIQGAYKNKRRETVQKYRVSIKVFMQQYDVLMTRASDIQKEVAYTLAETSVATKKVVHYDE
jgi:hypothetical protein